MEFINQKNTDQAAFEVLYDSFSLQEKAALDQWYKWTPEKWISKDRKRTPHISVKERYKAWQIALAGLIRDWMTEEDFPGKYSFLVSILQDIAEETEIKDEIQIGNEDHDVEMKATKSEGEEFDSNSDLSEERDEEEESDSDKSNIVQYSLRKKRRIIKDEDDAEGEKGLSDALRKSHRKSSPSKLTYESAPVTSNSKLSLTAQGSFEFERLCRNAEIRFSRTRSKDRIKILFFLAHSCVEPSVDIHSYIDQYIEKIAELKRNQRALIKDRKVMYFYLNLKDSKELREGFNKRDKQKLKELGVTNGVLEPNEVREEAINHVENPEESVIDGSEKIDEDVIEDSEKPDDLGGSEKIDDSVIDASDRPEEDDDADNESEYVFSLNI